MTFLIDENLSVRLCAALSASLGKVLHVSHVGLEAADDRDLWQYAITHQCIIISKDSDFLHRALLRQSPSPKVVWVDIGNLSTRETIRCLIENAADIMDFIKNPEQTVYILS